MKARLSPWPIPATNEGFGSGKSSQIELGGDLWWDWHRTQVILKVATGSGREGEDLISVADPGVCGDGRDALGEVLMASRDGTTGQKTMGAGSESLGLSNMVVQVKSRSNAHSILQGFLGRQGCPTGGYDAARKGLGQQSPLP